MCWFPLDASSAQPDGALRATFRTGRNVVLHSFTQTATLHAHLQQTG